jgi:hypothetical protein
MVSSGIKSVTKAAEPGEAATSAGEDPVRGEDPMRAFFAGVEVGDGDVSSFACLAAAEAAVVSTGFLVSAGFSIVAVAFSYDPAFVEDFQAVGIGARKRGSGNCSQFVLARIALKIPFTQNRNNDLALVSRQRLRTPSLTIVCRAYERVDIAKNANHAVAESPPVSARSNLAG